MHLDEYGNPVWRDGDVVRIQFKRKRTSDLSKEYEYVRTKGYWPGTGGWWSDKTDAEMTAAWNELRLSSMSMTHGPEPTATWLGLELGSEITGAWVVHTPQPDQRWTLAVFLDELEARRYADGPPGNPRRNSVVTFVLLDQLPIRDRTT
jgi:hypothetical protein